MIKSFLQYQDVDKELYAIESEISKSDERKTVALAKNKIDLANEQVAKISRECDELNRRYLKASEQVNKLLQDIKELTDTAESVGDSLQEIDYYRNNIDKLLDSLTSAESEINQAVEQVNAKKKELDNCMALGRKLVGEYKVAKDTYDKLIASKSDAVNEIKGRLTALEKDLNPDFLNTYKQIRKAIKSARVLVVKKGDCCGGCGMQLPQNILSVLNNTDDHAECPNCHRIIYVE